MGDCNWCLIFIVIDYKFRNKFVLIHKNNWNVWKMVQRFSLILILKNKFLKREQHFLFCKGSF